MACILLDPTKEHLSPKDVADALGFSAETVREWVRTGKLYGFVAGGSYRIPREALLRFLEESNPGRPVVLNGQGELATDRAKAAEDRVRAKLGRF